MIFLLLFCFIILLLHQNPLEESTRLKVRLHCSHILKNYLFRLKATLSSEHFVICYFPTPSASLQTLHPLHRGAQLQNTTTNRMYRIVN